MAHYKMKYFGSAQGKSGKDYHFGKGDIIEAPEGEFSESVAEDVSADFKEAKKERKTVKVSGKEAETASKEPKSEKR